MIHSPERKTDIKIVIPSCYPGSHGSCNEFRTTLVVQGDKLGRCPKDAATRRTKRRYHLSHKRN